MLQCPDRMVALQIAAWARGCLDSAGAAAGCTRRREDHFAEGAHAEENKTPMPTDWLDLMASLLWLDCSNPKPYEKNIKMKQKDSRTLLKNPHHVGASL